jgi:pimeloyl-ACP methyl ester carboxylesterase
VARTINDDGRSSIVTASGATDAHGTGQYAEVNGINLYFETHGAGRPLILLHGGLGSGEMFGPVLATLAERHQVFVVDLQGHGRTADIDRPLDVRLMADDIAALIDHLGLDTRIWWATRSAAGWRCTPRPGTRPRSADW